MFFSLEMHNGFLYLRYDFGFSNGPVLLEDSMRKARINDAKFHEVQTWLLSQLFDQLSQRLQAEIIAPVPMKGAKRMRGRQWYGRTGGRAESMQVLPVPSRGKGRLSLPPHKSVLVDRLCILLAKDRTIHKGESFINSIWNYIKESSLYQI